MLKGQAKTDYQREYMRKRRQGLTGLTERSNRTPDGSNRTGAKQSDLHSLIRSIETCPNAPQAKSKAFIPYYNPRVHRAGDTVRDRRSGRVVTVPELDGDYNPIPEL